MIKTILLDAYDITAKGYGLVDIQFEESIDLITNTIQLPNAKITIHDVDNAINPYSANGLLHGINLQTFKVRLLDNFDHQVFEGKILDVKLNIENKELELEIENGLRTIFDQDLEFVVDEDDLQTPGDIIRDILIDRGLNSIIHYPSFNATITYQEGLAYYVGVTYLAEEKIKVGTAIEELAFISGCDFFYTEGLLHLKHYPSYSNVRITGKTIEPDDLINEGTEIRQENSYIRNNYVVEAKGTGDTNNVIIKDEDFGNVGEASRVKYGSKDVNAINLNIDNSKVFARTTSNSVLASVETGENYIKRFQDQLLILEYTLIVTEHPRYVLGDYIDFNLSVLKYNITGLLFYIKNITFNHAENTVKYIAIQELNKSI